ncbi:MAG: hypothetical protein GY816_12840 [Cytophagales bacterium]|nr:hypothetical protein [Cytophagales bacterium]
MEKGLVSPSRDLDAKSDTESDVELDVESGVEVDIEDVVMVMRKEGVSWDWRRRKKSPKCEF